MRDDASYYRLGFWLIVKSSLHNPRNEHALGFRKYNLVFCKLEKNIP